MSLKRVQKEINTMLANPENGITINTVNDNIFHLRAILSGPKDTPYENGSFVLNINIPGEYPFKPPIVRFETKIYHCNINESGDICLDLLKDKWSPALTIDRLILSISSLLADPNPNDPLSPQIANLYRTNKEQHDLTAKEWTQKYASK